jgi:UDP-glucose 4-epimerase
MEKRLMTSEENGLIKCFVTGHRGFIGTRLFSQLKELGYDVKGMDLVEYQNVIEDLDSLGDWRPDYIFHLAAIPRVPYSLEHPEEVLENNVLSTIRILDYARRSGTRRVIYSSSSSVVGNGDGPTSPYGASKLIPETLCKNYSDVFNLDTVCLRYFNVYSEDQTVKGPYATAIANFMHCIREDKNPYITGDGEQRRDMLHVADAVSANIFCMNYEGYLGGQNFDTATGANISLNEIKEIVHKYHPGVVFDKMPERRGDVRETCADTRPLKALGWSTKVDVIDGIHSCFNFEE